MDSSLRTRGDLRRGVDIEDQDSFPKSSLGENIGTNSEVRRSVLLSKQHSATCLCSSSRDHSTPESSGPGPEPGCLSMKSDRSMQRRIDFRERPDSEDERLSGCMIPEGGCASLASALVSNPSQYLSYNHPGGPGLELLSDGLKSQDWRLETLRLVPGGQ